VVQIHSPRPIFSMSWPPFEIREKTTVGDFVGGEILRVQQPQESSMFPLLHPSMNNKAVWTANPCLPSRGRRFAPGHVHYPNPCVQVNYRGCLHLCPTLPTRLVSPLFNRFLI
jgi:hypothetical protein